MELVRNNELENMCFIPFNKMIDAFVENQNILQRSKQTCRSYFETLKRFYKYLCSKYNRPITLGEINATEIEEYLYYLVDVKGNSIRTRNDALTIIKQFYKFCILKNYCKQNLAESIEFIRSEKKERVYMTERETRLIFEAVEKPIIKLALQTLYYTGMRIGELTELIVSDIDYENNTIRIRNGKGKKERVIPLHEELKKLLLDYVENWRTDIDTENLFCTKTGKISQVYISTELKKTLILAGIEKEITPHTYRHTFASNLIKNNVNVVQVQKLLGHESLLTTGIYTHSSIEDLSQAVKTLNIIK